MYKRAQNIVINSIYLPINKAVNQMNPNSCTLVSGEEGTNTGVRINEKKLTQILDILYRAIIHSEGVYSTVKMETHAPQAIFYPGSEASQPKSASPQRSFLDEAEDIATLVEPGTLEHRQWLWFSTLTDRREDSMRVYAAHCKIYADHPEFYTKEVAYISLPKFRDALVGKYKIGSPRDSAGNWQICALTLLSRFDGDPVKLLSHAGWSVESVYAWKQAQKRPKEKGGIGYDPIPGWGRKLLSLYFLYLAELGFPLPDDVFASDVHAQALAIQTKIFEYGDKDEVSSAKLAEMLRVAASKYCREKKRDTILVAHASWLLGSNLCESCAERVDAPLLCPVYRHCSGRVDTSFYWKKGLWPKNLTRFTKGGERPAFGLPTDVTPRLKQRGVAVVIPINPLFPQKRLIKKSGQEK